MLEEGFDILERHSSSRRGGRGTDDQRENGGSYDGNGGSRDEGGPGTSRDGEHDQDNDTRNNDGGEEEMEVEISQI